MSQPEINFDSQWNMATAYFFRMHTELALSNHFGAIGDYQNQFNRLFNLHKELSGQMKPEELKKAEDLELRARQIVRTKGMGVDFIRQALYDYEIHLREIMKQRKMDLPRSKDPGKAIIAGSNNDGNYN